MARSPGRLLGLSVEVGTTAAVIGIIWLLTADSHNPFIPSLPTIVSRFRSVWLFQRFTSDLLPSVERLALVKAQATVAAEGHGPRPSAAGADREPRVAALPHRSHVAEAGAANQ